MTTPFLARRRAEELSSVVDGHLAPENASTEVRELAGVVTVLRSAADAAPRAEFAADLRARLMAEAATVLTPAPASLRLPARRSTGRERRLVAAVTAAVVLGGSAGMAAAAQQALPGEALYPIKRGLEHAQAGLSTSADGKGRDLLGQADDRLEEAGGLLSGDTTGRPQVPATVAAFTDQAREGSGLLLGSFEKTQDPASVVAVRTFAADAIVRLQDLARTAPPEAQDELAEAATALSEIDAQARGLCRTCAADLPGLDVPAVLLAAAEADRALRQAGQDVLDNSHPVVVPRTDGKHRKPKQDPSAPAVPLPTPSLPDSGDSDGGGSGLPLPLPSLGSSSKDGSTSGLGGAVDGLTGTLDGVVETLLPDPLG